MNFAGFIPLVDDEPLPTTDEIEHSTSFEWAT
jgi:hypothetical protein